MNVKANACDFLNEYQIVSDVMSASMNENDLDFDCLTCSECGTNFTPEYNLKWHAKQFHPQNADLKESLNKETTTKNLLSTLQLINMYVLYAKII